MKKGDKEHKVPLSDAAMAVLNTMREIRQSAYLFPGFKPGQPIGADTLRELIKKFAGDDVTVHGLRSTFRDWAADCTSFPNELAEMALSHAIPTAVEKAYRRGSMFEKRCQLMDAWANYCAGTATGEKVVQMPSTRR